MIYHRLTGLSYPSSDKTPVMAETQYPEKSFFPHFRLRKRNSVKKKGKDEGRGKDRPRLFLTKEGEDRGRRERRRNPLLSYMKEEGRERFTFRNGSALLC